MADAQPWQQVTLNSPRTLIEPDGSNDWPRVTAPGVRADRRVFSEGGTSMLVNELGAPLATVDVPLTYLSGRWAIGTKGLVLDLDSGRTFVHKVANVADVEAHREKRHETMFVVGDQLWWTTLSPGGGRVWMGRVEPDRATRAQPYKLSDELMPNVGAAWHAPTSRLLVSTHGDCRITALGAGEVECLLEGKYGPWHLAGDLLFPLKEPIEVAIDVGHANSLPIQTPCPDLTFVGAHAQSGNLFYICSDGGFGLYTGRNEFLHAAARQDVNLMAAGTLPWHQRFARLGHRPIDQVVLDFEGGLIEVPGVVAVGVRYAISSRDGNIFVTDLEKGTTEPYSDAPCEKPRIAHLAADRFVMACTKLGEPVVDGEEQSLMQRFQAAAMVHQSVIDPPDRTIYAVKGQIRTATSKALFVGPGVDVHVFPSSR